MDFLSVCKQHVQFGLQCDKRKREVVHRLSHVIRDWSKQRYISYIQKHVHDTLLLQYGSDCTPLTTVRMWKQLCDEFNVVRYGRSSDDWLIQRLSLTNSTGDSVCVFEEPLRMLTKTQFAHFCAFRDLVKSPREHGHMGLLVTFTKFDRAVQGGMERFCKKNGRLGTTSCPRERPKLNLICLGLLIGTCTKLVLLMMLMGVCDGQY